MSMFQRRHYELLAKWAAEQPSEVAESLKRFLLSENPNFKPSRFAKAVELYQQPSPKHILIEALALLTRPNGWTKWDAALNHDLQPVDPGAPEACTFCALGAIDHVILKHNANGTLANECCKLLRKAGGFADAISTWNDRSTKRDVLATFLRAIELAP